MHAWPETEQDEPRLTETKPSTRLPLSQLEKELTALHETIAMLENRLSAVLTPEYPSERVEGSTEATEREGSPLYYQLLANNRSLESARGKLKALMDRLEC